MPMKGDMSSIRGDLLGAQTISLSFQSMEFLFLLMIDPDVVKNVADNLPLSKKKKKKKDPKVIWKHLIGGAMTVINWTL